MSNPTLLSTADALRLLADQLQQLNSTALPELGNRTPATVLALTCPRIGDYWVGQGGHYAGIVRGRDGAADYHLIVGPDVGDECTWDAAWKRAQALQVDEHHDFDLPYRAEQAVMFGNVPELFEQTFYWSREHHASSSGFAYGQDFAYGDQSYWRKGDEDRARAVRRLPIQPFIPLIPADSDLGAQVTEARHG